MVFQKYFMSRLGRKLVLNLVLWYFPSVHKDQCVNFKQIFLDILWSLTTLVNQRKVGGEPEPVCKIHGILWILSIGSGEIIVFGFYKKY